MTDEARWNRSAGPAEHQGAFLEGAVCAVHGLIPETVNERYTVRLRGVRGGLIAQVTIGEGHRATTYVVKQPVMTDWVALTTLDAACRTDARLGRVVPLLGVLPERGLYVMRSVGGSPLGRSLKLAARSGRGAILAELVEALTSLHGAGMQTALQPPGTTRYIAERLEGWREIRPELDQLLSEATGWCRSEETALMMHPASLCHRDVSLTNVLVRRVGIGGAAHAADGKWLPRLTLIDLDDAGFDLGAVDFAYLWWELATLEWLPGWRVGARLLSDFRALLVSLPPSDAADWRYAWLKVAGVRGLTAARRRDSLGERRAADVVRWTMAGGSVWSDVPAWLR